MYSALYTCTVYISNLDCRSMDFPGQTTLQVGKTALTGLKIRTPGLWIKIGPSEVRATSGET